MFVPHPLDQLNAYEIKAAAATVRSHAAEISENTETDGAQLSRSVRFNTITLAEPPKAELLAFQTNGKEGGGVQSDAIAPPMRRAYVIFMVPSSGAAYEAHVALTVDGEGEVQGRVMTCDMLPAGAQPLISPDDCDLAERIVKADAGIATLLKERYGITDLGKIPVSFRLFDRSESLCRPRLEECLSRISSFPGQTRRDTDTNNGKSHSCQHEWGMKSLIKQPTHLVEAKTGHDGMPLGDEGILWSSSVLQGGCLVSTPSRTLLSPPSTSPGTS